MAARNLLLEAPPYAVADALTKLGNRLRTARLRRNLTVVEVGKKIGAGSRAVTDAEKGKATTGIAIYAALLWAFDMLGDLETMADPVRDLEGVALASRRERSRARRSKGLDNEF
jgi:transcriptional regulator with XRE-family HTH domain